MKTLVERPKKEVLLEKIADKTAVVAVLGLGYVGLPLCLRFVETGFPLLGLDVDGKKVDALERGEGYIATIDIGPLVQAARRKRFRATTDFSQVIRADVVILCVPTPLNRHREPDLSFVTRSVNAIVPHLKAGMAISLESTTYPGTTEEQLLPRIEKAGWTVGEDIFLIYSPEREDPGNQDFPTRIIPKICGGVTADCLEVGRALYEKVADRVVPVSSTRAAELTKLLENTYRAVNIALVNELKIVAERMGLDIFEVVRAAATKPFGYMPFYPGPGLGGHCIPIDPFYLTWKAREHGIATKFIELAGEINTSMPDYVVSRVVWALNRQGKPLSRSRVLVLGASYKKNVDDMRESPSVVLMEKLLDLGAEVAYCDPHVPKLPRMREHYLDLSSVSLTASALAEADCVLIATDHDLFDWELVRAHAKLIVDTRGVFDPKDGTILRA